MRRIILALLIGSAFLRAGGEGALEQGNNAYESKDFKSAFEFFEKSCNEGSGKGCFNLAIMYDKGEGVKKSKSKAIHYFQKACDNGEMQVCVLMGVIYEDLGR